MGPKEDWWLQCPDPKTTQIEFLCRFPVRKVTTSVNKRKSFLQVNVRVMDRGALRSLWWSENEKTNHQGDEMWRPIHYSLRETKKEETNKPATAIFTLKSMPVLILWKTQLRNVG